jgi:hypothetical protein
MKRILPVTTIIFCLVSAVLLPQEKPAAPDERAAEKAPQLSIEAALERMFSANEALKAAGQE